MKPISRRTLAKIVLGMMAAGYSCPWRAMGVAAEADKEGSNQLPAAVKRFLSIKEKQIRAVAERVGLNPPPEMEEFLKLAKSGDWQQAKSLYQDARAAARTEGEEPDHRSMAAVQMAALLEIILAFDVILETEPALALKLGDALMTSIPRGAIYFGGTDPGRGLPTALSTSHPQGDPFFTVTQNALADGLYLAYLRDMYGRQLYMPSEADSTRSFQEYMDDAQRRLEHDREHPNEPKQIKPGEDVRLRNNRVQVSGQVAVMAINALLARIIFEQNPDREFFVEESFPLAWMYPHLTPHNAILKLHRQPVASISGAEIEKEQAYWSRLQKPLIGDWLKPSTSIDEIIGFARKVYVDRNVQGFAGDAKFLQSQPIRMTYAKLRSATGGVYAWRHGQARDSKVKAQMLAGAEAAFRQGFAFCPTSPEIVFRYANLLIAESRVSDTLKLAELAENLEPNNGQFAGLVQELRRMEGRKPKAGA